jgi:hypothetical protein
MVEMPDMMESLKSLQDALNNGEIFQIQTCALNKHYKVILDQPLGNTRFSYAKMEKGQVQAFSVFVQADHINGVPCFNIGYAVQPKYRGKGLAIEAVNVGVEELKNGLGRAGVKEFYVESVIDATNIPSIKVSEKLFSTVGTEVTDSNSQKLCVRFEKLVKV